MRHVPFGLALERVLIIFRSDLLKIGRTIKITLFSRNYGTVYVYVPRIIVSNGMPIRRRPSQKLSTATWCDNYDHDPFTRHFHRGGIVIRVNLPFFIITILRVVLTPGCRVSIFSAKPHSKYEIDNTGQLKGIIIYSVFWHVLHSIIVCHIFCMSLATVERDTSHKPIINAKNTNFLHIDWL